MAIIGQIRSKSGLVVGFVAVALILFVLSDFLGGNGSGAPEEMIAGEVYGQEIPYAEYEAEAEAQVNAAQQERINNKVEELKQQIMFEFMSKGIQPTEEQTNLRIQEELDKLRDELTLRDDEKDQIRDDVFNQKVNRIIFDKLLPEFNFAIPSNELNDMIFGDNIQDYIKKTKMFQNKYTGEFSLDSVKLWRTKVDKSKEGKTWWVNNIEQPIKETRKINKYFNLINKGVYVTNAEVLHNHIASNRTYKISFVTKPYSDIADSTIKVTDEEITEYYNKNKNRKQFESQGSRKFSWVEFMLAPSDADVSNAKTVADDVLARFKESKDDSLFVMTNAESKNFIDDFTAVGMYPVEVDSTIQNADSGTFVGPYRDGDFWKILKVRGIKYEEQAKCKHILIAFQGAVRSEATRTKDQAKKLADSLATIIKKGTKLDDLVMRYSDDGGKNQNGGTYDWFAKDVGFTQKFKDFAFAAKSGEVKVVETEFGFHVMEGMGQRNYKKAKTAIVDVKIRPSKETDMAVRAKAMEFISKMKDNSEFQKAAQSLKLNVQEREITWTQKAVDNTPGGRSMAGWVHNANQNDVSEPRIYNDRYVVIKLDLVKQKGVPDLDDVYDIMKLEVLREKKGEMITKEMKGAKSLEELANRLKTKVQDAEIRFADPAIPGTNGAEYEVIGSIFSMNKPGQMSFPLAGKNGAFVVKIEGITEAPALTDATASKAALTKSLRDSSKDRSYMAIRTLAKIDDKRRLY